MRYPHLHDCRSRWLIRRLRHPYALLGISAVLIFALTIPLVSSSGFAVAYASHGKKHHGDGQGQGQQQQQQQQQAAAINCTLSIPANPLTPQGLATPYLLANPNQGGGQGNGNGQNQNQQNNGDGQNQNQQGNQQNCREANKMSAAFVQAVAFDPVSHALGIYNPVVVDSAHPTPALQPVLPQFPPTTIVALWFGFNGTNLTLTGPGFAEAGCVNGLPGSIFGQVSYCNAANFFQAVNQAIQQNQITIPPIGQANDGLPCPTVRDFSLIDQDQSDNVPVSYLVTAQGAIAQNTPANQLQLQGAQTLANGSDEGLASTILFPALGCSSWSAPDLAALAQGQQSNVTALALNELQAAMYQKAPIALVPLSDPMTVVMDNNGNPQPSMAKTDAYRIGVDQPMITAAADAANAGSGPYCQNIIQVALPRLASQQFQQLTQNHPSPDPMKATNLFLFMAQRLRTTLGNNGGLTPSCMTTLGLKKNPVTVQTDGNGVVTAAQINPNVQGNGTNGSNGQNCPQQNGDTNQTTQQGNQPCATPTPTGTPDDPDQG